MSVTIERLVAEIEADPEGAIRALGRLGAAIDTAAKDRTAVIDIDTKRAEANLHSLTQASNRNRASINTLGGEVHTTSKFMQGLGIAAAGVKFGALYAGATAAAAGLGVLAGAAAGATAALAPLTGLLGALPVLTTAAVGGIGAMILGFSGVGKAVQAYTKVQESASAATKTSNEQARRVASAERGVAEARRGVVAATKAVREAEAGIAQARKDAARALVEQRQDAVLAGFAQTEAVLALEEAQERLRKAQERTARGGQTLMRQTDDFTGKVYEVAFTSTDDVDAPDVKGAQRDVIRAQIELERAKHRNKTQQEALNDAERKGIDNSDHVVAAKQRHTRALDDLGRSQQNLVDSQARLADAQARLNEKLAGGSAAAKAYEIAMGKLTQEGRDFVAFMTGTFMPALGGFRKSAQRNLLPPVQEGLKSFMGLFDMLKEQTGQFTKIMGEGIRDFLKGVSTKEFEATIKGALTGVQPILTRLLDAALPLANVFLQITKAATPMTNLLVGKMVGGLERLSRWMDTTAGKEKMLRFFDQAGKFTLLWWDVLKPLATAIAGVVKAATPLAEWMLEKLAGYFQRLSDSANSISGQTAMKDWFNDLKAPIEELGGVFNDFIALFFDPRIDNSGLTNTLKAIRRDFLPPLRELVVSLSKSNFGAAFVEFLGNLLKGINALVKNDGPLTLLVSGINKLADALGWLSQKTGGGSTLAILGALAALKGFKIARGAFDSLKGLFSFGKDRGSTPANPLFVWSVNGGAGGAPVPGGGKVKTVVKNAVKVAKKAGPAAALAAIGVAGWKGAKAANSSQGEAQRKAIIAEQKRQGQEGALSGFNAWMKTALHHGIGSAPVIGKYVRKELDAIPPLAKKAGQRINDDLSLGMRSNILKTQEAARTLARQPDNAMNARRSIYIASGTSAVSAVAAGLAAGRPQMNTKAKDLGGLLGTGIAEGLKAQYPNLRKGLLDIITKMKQAGASAGAIKIVVENDARFSTEHTNRLTQAGDGPGRAGKMAGAAISRFGGRVTSGYRTPAANRAAGGSPGSYHLDKSNPANDLVTSNMGKTFTWLRNTYGGQIREMIYGARMFKNGVESFYPRTDHWDHIHLAHKGGVVSQNWPTVPGLRSDERPAILQVGERVVPKQRAGGELSPAQLEAILQRVMANAKAPVQIDQTFNEKVNPEHVGAELAWRLA